MKIFKGPFQQSGMWRRESVKNFVKLPSMTPNFAFPCLSLVFVFVFVKIRVLSIYIGKQEIEDGKSNGSRPA